MFEKRYQMHNGYGVPILPEVQFNTSDLAEMLKKQGVTMPTKFNEAFLSRYREEFEKCAQNAMVAICQNLFANPHVQHVYEITTVNRVLADQHGNAGELTSGIGTQDS